MVDGEPVRPPRRVVTGHDAEGRSVVLGDGPAPRSHPIPGATFHEVWNTTEMPASIGARQGRDPTERPLLTPPDPHGTIVRIVDLEPRSRSPMHRTETVDYGIVLAGDVLLVLDDGSETALSAGDVVVQRGTDHAWANPGDEPARIGFVLLDGRFTDDLRTLLGPDLQLFDHAVDV
jgi:quercetin dioxygenase-like cupin family protein